jgi:hypothetical protein
VDGAVILGLFLIGVGTWLAFLGLSGIRDHIEAQSAPDDLFEVDDTELHITVIGISLLMGLGAIALGGFILFA